MHPDQLWAALEALSGLNPMSSQVRNIVPSYDIVTRLGQTGTGRKSGDVPLSYLSQKGYGTDWWWWGGQTDGQEVGR